MFYPLTPTRVGRPTEELATKVEVMGVVETVTMTPQGSSSSFWYMCRNRKGEMHLYTTNKVNLSDEAWTRES